MAPMIIYNTKRMMDPKNSYNTKGIEQRINGLFPLTEFQYFPNWLCEADCLTKRAEENIQMEEGHEPDSTHG